MLSLEDICEGEWVDWYKLTPLERWHESEKLLANYISIGGSLDPEPDSQSPFDAGGPASPRLVDGGPGLRVLRRGGV
jgi:hypothetical protein